MGKRLIAGKEHVKALGFRCLQKLAVLESRQQSSSPAAVAPCVGALANPGAPPGTWCGPRCGPVGLST